MTHPGSDLPHPLVSIILPVKSAHRDCEVLLRLLEVQDFRNFELIVMVDNLDKAPQLYDRLFSTATFPTAVHRSSACGVANLRNEALHICTGQYIWFIDADDQFPASLLGQMVQALRSTGTNLVQFGYDEVWPSGRTLSHRHDDRIICGQQSITKSMLSGEMHGYLWTKLIARSVIPPNPFPAQMRIHSDLAGIINCLGTLDTVALSNLAGYQYQRSSRSLIASLHKHAFEDLVTLDDFTVQAVSAGHINPSFAHALRVRHLHLNYLRRAIRGALAPRPTDRATLRSRITARQILRNPSLRLDEKLLALLVATDPVYTATVVRVLDSAWTRHRQRTSRR